MILFYFLSFNDNVTKHQLAMDANHWRRIGSPSSRCIHNHKIAARINESGGERTFVETEIGTVLPTINNNTPP